MNPKKWNADVLRIREVLKYRNSCVFLYQKAVYSLLPTHCWFIDCVPPRWMFRKNAVCCPLIVKILILYLFTDCISTHQLWTVCTSQQKYVTGCTIAHCTKLYFQTFHYPPPLPSLLLILYSYFTKKARHKALPGIMCGNILFKY